MRLIVLAALAASVALAADSDFNGRWDIRVPKEPRARAWWLEVEGAGTPGIKGRFVGFPGGNTDPIPEIRVTDGILHFSADRGQGQKKVHLEYTAKLVGEARRRDAQREHDARMDRSARARNHGA